jgi:hypothetical protein
LASREVGRDSGLTTRLNASRGGVYVHKEVVLQLHTRGDVVKMDGIVCVLFEPGHKQPTNSEGGQLARVVGRVHTTTERVRGVREHVHLAHVLETDALSVKLLTHLREGAMPNTQLIIFVGNMLTKQIIQHHCYLYSGGSVIL